MTACGATIDLGGGPDYGAEYGCGLVKGHDGPHVCKGDLATRAGQFQPFRIEWWDRVRLPRVVDVRRVWRQ